MKSAIANIRKELAEIYSKEEIESLIFLIFEHVKAYSRTRFLLAYDEILSDEDCSVIGQILNRLKNHEPIQYILGVTEFFGMKYYTNAGVLIPRPETEELVQWVLQENKPEEPFILDIGTGTGCIALSLKKNIPGSSVWACDVSPVCIETASLNATENGLKIDLFVLDILNHDGLDNIPILDIIVSNPPYICESEKLLMDRNVLDFEPETALFVPDADPLKFYSRIADIALVKLNSGGQLYFEINEAFGRQCVDLLLDKGFSGIELRKDIHGKDRMIRALR